jgi:Xaa-Pro aminopeptidase
MAGAGIDAMIICSRGDEFVRGRVQYVSDIFQWAGWGMVVLPQKGEPTFIGDPLWGLSRVALVNWIQDFRATQTPAVEIAGILSDHGISNGTIGIVGLADITSAAHYAGFQEAFGKTATLVDATDIFDDIKAVKSDEEIENLRETSRIIALVFRSLEGHIRPGAIERDILAEAHRLVRQHGCLDGIAQMSRQPYRAYTFGMDAEIERDDVLCIDLEWGGPSGYWVEVRRTYSFGRPSDQILRYWDTRIETLDACVDAMKTGASSDEVLAARDRVHRKYGQGGFESVAYTAHGIGLDSHEVPWVPGKERVMETNMVINLHPQITFDDPAEALAVGGICVSDNVRVTPDGGERLTYDRDELVDLDA